MKSLRLSVLAIAAVVLLATGVRAETKSNRFVPSPVPVNMKPVDYNEERLGIGYNLTTITSDWNDPFFQSGEEKIGEIEYTVNHLVVGKLVSKNDVSATEYDLLVGVIDSENKTTQYFSRTLGQNVKVSHSGSGWDIGARIVSSRTLYKQLGSDGKRFIDWNWAWALHAALFSTEGSFRGASVNGQEVEAYSEEETGIFLRPVVALQPIIRMGNVLSLVPYVGVGTQLTLSSYYWWDTEYVHLGTSQPGQLTEGEGFYSTFTGIQVTAGFDIGIVLSSDRKHGLTIGGAMSQIFGDAESDFNEVHVLYTFPM